ncbi:MAG: hypothetical protein QOJ00_762 [Actinomycetota bacterium]|jgi:hypothetical protein
MQWAELADFLDSGVAMLGASADEHGQPEPFRIWSASVPTEGRVRVLINAEARRTFECVTAGTRIALLFSDIGTFRSLQMKGAATGAAQPSTPDDMARFRRYEEHFGIALAQIGHPPRLNMSMRPLGVFAVEVDVEQMFDQTPGPGAGAEVRA